MRGLPRVVNTPSSISSTADCIRAAMNTKYLLSEMGASTCDRAAPGDDRLISDLTKAYFYNGWLARKTAVSYS